MKKALIISLVVVTLVAISLAIVYFIWNIPPENITPQNNPTLSQTNTNSVSTQNSGIIKQQNNYIESNWKTYTNKQTGFTFQYPSTWSKNGEDAKVVDLSGNTTAIHINFIDTISKTTLLIIYYLAPKGADIYNYAYSQYQSSQGWYATGGKEIEIAGHNAIMASTTLRVDGKGNELDQPLRLIIVDLLDKKQTGTIELQFKTQIINEDREVVVFNRLLSSFKFTK